MRLSGFIPTRFPVKYLLFVLIILATVVLLAYAPIYPEKRLGPMAAASIRNGVTTNHQVRALLGAPQSVARQIPMRQPDGSEPLPAKLVASEIWTYWTGTSHELPFVGKRARYLVTVFLDERGIVLDCQTELLN